MVSEIEEYNVLLDVWNIINIKLGIELWCPAEVIFINFNINFFKKYITLQ
jgi:hypothetical protein